jgi:hypothetical protein
VDHATARAIWRRAVDQVGGDRDNVNRGQLVELADEIWEPPPSEWILKQFRGNGEPLFSIDQYENDVTRRLDAIPVKIVDLLVSTLIRMKKFLPQGGGVRVTMHTVTYELDRGSKPEKKSHAWDIFSSAWKWAHEFMKKDSDFELWAVSIVARPA